MFKEINRIHPYKQGYVAYGITDGGGKATVNLCDIRSAIVAPVNDIPCYYLVCGMIDRRNMWGKKPIIFITEFGDQSAGRVFEKLIDDVPRLSITKVYADRGNEGFYASLWRYRSQNDVDISITPAVSVSNIGYGDSLISEAIRDKALITPKSYAPMVSEQVNQISGLGYDTDPKYESFYAWNALRYLLAGYVKNPPMESPRLADNDIGDPNKFNSRRVSGFERKNFSQWAV